MTLNYFCFIFCSLYPGDLYAFTRRPTFLIVDSDNSSAFSAVPQHFEQPLVVLMSPTDVPSTFRGMDKLLINIGYGKGSGGVVCVSVCMIVAVGVSIIHMCTSFHVYTLPRVKEKKYQTFFHRSSISHQKKCINLNFKKTLFFTLFRSDVVYIIEHFTFYTKV